PTITSTPFVSTNTTTPEIYTLSLHDALPIYVLSDERRAVPLHGHQLLQRHLQSQFQQELGRAPSMDAKVSEIRHQCSAHLFAVGDRKSTRLNSSHQIISYAVFCLKKKIRQIR